MIIDTFTDKSYCLSTKGGIDGINGSLRLLLAASSNGRLNTDLKTQAIMIEGVYQLTELGEYSKKMGPVVMGKIKTDSAKIGYEPGWLFGFDDVSEHIEVYA